MNRKTARELTFKLLYSIEIYKDELEQQISTFIENNEIVEEEAKQYITDIVIGIYKEQEKIDELISKNLKKDWAISRIAKIDLSLLKLSIYEILYTDIPFKVAINEVVELAKKYSDDQSPSFINGILAEIVKDK